MAKFEIKDGFWWLECKVGAEWNFIYVMSQESGKPTQLMISTSLQMEWMESLPYFCVTSKTMRYEAMWYVNTSVGKLPLHKLLDYSIHHTDVQQLAETLRHQIFDTLLMFM